MGQASRLSLYCKMLWNLKTSVEHWWDEEGRLTSCIANMHPSRYSLELLNVYKLFQKSASVFCSHSLEALASNGEDGAGIA